MSDAPDLYDTDFARWADGQARALRDAGEAGHNLPLDWRNLAEEVEGLARTDRRELRSRIETILEHLLKLAHSPAADPRLGWKSTIRRVRGEVQDLLDENQSFRAELPKIISGLSGRVEYRVAKDLEERGEMTRAVATRLQAGQFSEEEVLGDWFPPEQA